jgi:hypothetical protein
MYNPLNLLRLKSLFGGADNPMPQMPGSYNPMGQSPDMPPMDIGMQPDMGMQIPDGSDVMPPQMQQPPMAQPPMQQPMGGGDDIQALMSQLYQPEHQSIDKFNDLSGQYPIQKEPGKLRKIAGVALGTMADTFGKGGGKGAYDEITGKTKYNEDVASWKNQLDPLKDAANIERQGNTNSRTMAYQTVTAKLRQDAQDAKTQNDTVRANISQQRANAYEFKIRNPNVTFDFTSPYVMVKNPATGAVTKALDNEGKPIETGNLNDTDKAALNQKNALARIDATGDQNRQTVGVKHDATMSEIDERGSQARDTKSVPSGSSSANKPELPTQTRIRQFNAARALYNTRPDLRPFIKIGSPGTNDFSITPPNKGTTVLGHTFGASGDDAKYKEITDAIYGDPAKPVASHETAPVVTNGSPTSMPTGKTVTRNPQTLTRRVRNKTTGEEKTQTSRDGGVTWSFD